MKKLIKRLEEQAVEINELKKTISQLSSIQEVKHKVFNELDKEENKELEEAIEIMSQWKRQVVFPKHNLDDRELEAIETILKHLEK